MRFLIQDISPELEEHLSHFYSRGWDDEFFTEGIPTIIGVDRSVAEKLNEQEVRNPYHLIGTFLRFNRPNENTQKRCDLFMQFLMHAGIDESRASLITYALAMKLDRYFPGFFRIDELEMAGWEEPRLPPQAILGVLTPFAPILLVLFFFAAHRIYGYFSVSSSLVQQNEL